jgi:Flp pilus assembly protein TadD
VILFSQNPGDTQKAADFVTKAREAFPDDAELAKAYGIVVYRQGNFARAAGLLKESLAKLPDDADAVFYLGMAQARLKDAAGKKSLQRALEMSLKPELAAEARKTLSELK